MLIFIFFAILYRFYFEPKLCRDYILMEWNSNISTRLFIYKEINIKNSIQPNLKFNLSIKNIYIFGNNFPENVGVNK